MKYKSLARPDASIYRVIGYVAEPREGACRDYRMLTPLSKLQKHHSNEYFTVVADSIMSPKEGKESVAEMDDYKDFDIMIFQRSYQLELWQHVLKAKEHGIKTVYETDDDLFCVPAWNPNHSFWGKKDVQEGVLRFLSTVDAVFTSTEQLKSVYQEYNPNVYVIPNAVDFENVSVRPDNNKKVVVGYQGSATHSRDFALIEGVLENLANNRKDLFIKLFTNKKMKDAHEIPFVIFPYFYTMLSQIDFDIGLAPLVDNRFNRGKSNVKWLEYSAHRTVTIASDVEPYSKSIEDGETGIIIRDKTEWIPKILELVQDEEKRRRIAENAYQKVRNDYDVNKVYLQWKEAIEDVLGGKNDAKALLGRGVS